MARTFARGSSQYLSVASTPVSDVPFSIACWFWTSEGDNSKELASVGSSDTESTTILRLSSSETVRSETIGGGSDAAAASSSSFTLSTWSHACGVWAASDSRAAYVNGGSKGTNSTSINLAGIDSLSIGTYTYNGVHGNYMDGHIAEVGIWNVALSDDEVAMLASGFAPPLVHPESLVAYWPLIRDDDDDRVGGYDMSATNSPTVSAHPAGYVFYPAPPMFYNVTAAGGVTVPVLYYHYRHH